MINSKLIITIPPPVVFNMKQPNGSVNTTLEFRPDFGRVYTNNFQKAQIFVDSEVLRFCSSQVPFDTGMLQKSGISGTAIGSGTVTYTVPYSAVQYYKTPTSRSYDANRGGMWFERGKAVERERILRGAMKIASGG